MKERLLSSLSLLGLAVFALLAGIVSLIGGYWLSDRVYDAGLWPIGMVMRVFLLFMLATVFIVPSVLVVSAITCPFKGVEEP